MKNLILLILVLSSISSCIHDNNKDGITVKVEVVNKKPYYYTDDPVPIKVKLTLTNHSNNNYYSRSFIYSSLNIKIQKKSFYFLQ